MEWPKVKNIIIIILLLVNGFLLILVGGQQRQVRHYEKSALTRAAQVLEQNGITVSDDALEQAAGEVLSPMTAARDPEYESALARALLGEDASCTDQSGGLYVYSGSDGTVVFRSNGDFNATLFNRTTDGRDHAGHAAGLLKDMGLEGELVDQEAGDNGAVTVIFRQLLEGIPLYSCRLAFEYSGDQLRSISGTLLAAETPVPSTEGGVLDVSTALIRFLEGILDRRDVCSAITGLRPGYRTAQSFGSTVLTPVWLVTTNISDYYLDGATGALSPVN